MTLSLRYARRDMRGASKSLIIAFLCLVLGVGSIAAVQSVSGAIESAIDENGRTILGGDVVVRNIYAPADGLLRGWFEAKGATFVETTEARVMAANAETDDNTLVELKAVPEGYPVYGTFESDAGTDLPNILKNKGVLLDPALRERLSVEKGGKIRLGNAEFTVRGFIIKEPDRAGGSRFGLAPRLIISAADAPATNLLQTGSMVYYDLRTKLPAGTDAKTVSDALKADFPDAPWKVTDSENASPQITRFLGRLTLFLTMVGLSTLLIGGIGIGNSVRTHLETRLKTIAILKMLGASRPTIEKIYLWQIAAISAAGTIVGLLIGMTMPFLLAPILSKFLPFAIEPAMTFGAVLLPAAFGLLAGFAFTLIPLGQAMAASPLDLFKSGAALLPPSAPRRYRVGALALFGLLAAAALLGARDPIFAACFIAGSALCYALLRLVGTALSMLAGRAAAKGRPALRLGLRNLYRPGNATSNTLVSLGLGLTVMMAVILTEANLRSGILDNLPDDAPAFFFLDIQPDQREPFEKLLSAQETARDVKLSPNLRGRIVAVNGIPAQDALIDKSESWLLQNDRGFTYAADIPAHSTITSGQWWPGDYKGPPLISVVDDVERGFGVKPGDTMTVNILGRDITATIANVRSVNWMNMTINFAITFAPGTLEPAPQTTLATVVADPSQEATIQRAIGRAFPNISMIRLSDAIGAITQMMGNMAGAVRAAAFITIVTGILVLAGSLAATRAQRLYDIVILKVLGVERSTLLKSLFYEFAILGLAASGLAIALGALISWGVMVPLMDMQWRFYAAPALLVAAAGTGLTVIIGWVVTGRVLSSPVAGNLRSDL